MAENSKQPKDVNVEMKRLVDRMKKRSAGRPGRDPKRIPVMLKALEEIWRMNTDMRLGQLIANATTHKHPSFVCSEIFYIEDDEMLQYLEEMIISWRAAKATNPAKPEKKLTADIMPLK